MTKFCHIAPTQFLDMFAGGRSHHLTLAHLIETDEEYTNWYANQRGDTVNIMDNSAFEMYKQGREMYPSDKLIEMGNRVEADYIVMSDYPGEPSSKTIEAAVKMGPELKEAGFGRFFVPQSEIGDLDDLTYAFDWAAASPHVDYIGVSILAVPNAYGVERDNKLQRFLSRRAFMQHLTQCGILQKIVNNEKKIHFLGMVDGPNEVELVGGWLPYIDTWDSSAAVWAGLNGIAFDNSPTGLINGKFEKEVDFNYKVEDVGKTSREFIQRVALAKTNCEYIDRMINKTLVDVFKAVERVI